MKTLHRFSIRHPVLVVVIAVLGTIAIAPGIHRLRLRTDGHALVPEGAPAVGLDRAVRREFGIRDPIIVLVRSRHPDGIYNPRTLRLVADLTTELAGAPELDSGSVRSLATEPSDRFRAGTLAHRRLLEPFPATRSALDSLRSDIAAIGLLTGTLVSFDGRATAIHVGTPPQADRTALISTIHDVIARADTSGHQVDIIGAPVAEALLGTHILEDLGVSGAWSGLRTRRLADRPDAGLGAISRFRVAIARHVGLLPLSIAVMALVFLLSFRSFTAMLLPLAEAGACLVFVFGLMGWTGVPVYLTMAVLPVILVAMGLADEIHVFASYSRHRAAQPGEPVATVVRAALDETSLPVVVTAMTTAVGFLSFAVSPLAPVRAFGLFTAAGILFCMLWTLTAVPALLVLLAPRGFHSPGAAGRAILTGRSGWWIRLASRAPRQPGWTLAAAALGLALCPLGFRQLHVQDGWISGFARESAFYRATQYFNRQFYGTHRLLLAIDTGHVELRGRIASADMSYHELRLPAHLVPDPEWLAGCSVVVSRRAGATGGRGRAAYWSSVVESAGRRGDRIVVTTPLVHGSALFLLAPAPAETLEYALRSQRLALPGVLRRIEELEQFIRTQGRWAVGGVLGPADEIATAEFLTSDRVPGFRMIPSDPDHVRWLWSAIGLVQGPERLREMADPGLERGLVSVFLQNANFVDTARLMEALRAYERTRLLPERIRFDFAGDVAVSQTLVEAIVNSQVRSLSISLLGILAVTALLFRSLRWGFVCMMPAGLAVAAAFALMGWTGMPLGVATSMFAGMVLGSGVDFAIHLVDRYRSTVARGATCEAAIADSLAVTGPPILINALAVALGFGILVLSRVPANARLGAITMVSLIACLAATLLVIPALLRLAGGKPPASVQ